MPLFGSKEPSTARVRVLTLDYVVEGTAELSGQNLIRLYWVTDATMRPASGGAAPEPLGSTWAVGENDEALIAIAALDSGGAERLEGFGNPGRHELRADVFTGPYRVRGTIASPDDDPRVVANLGRIVMRDAEIACLAPGGDAWAVPSVLLFMRQVQGIVLA
jgi:hypothetical protein